MVIERMDIWKAEERDGPWNELVLAYALAFGRLAGPPDPGKPETWTIAYQAAVHDMHPLPPPDGFRATCQHDTWYFLPWHRMYLLHYEAVVRAIIAELDDDRISDETRETWALPYWDYHHPDHRILPQAFRDELLPDGTPNPLAQAARYPMVQSGAQPLSDDEVEFSGWWSETVFTLPGLPSFGGTDVGKRHRPFQFADAGALEITPHGSVHMYVGWDMMAFHTAGTDPSSGSTTATSTGYGRCGPMAAACCGPTRLRGAGWPTRSTSATRGGRRGPRRRRRLKARRRWVTPTRTRRRRWRRRPRRGVATWRSPSPGARTGASG